MHIDIKWSLPYLTEVLFIFKFQSNWIRPSPIAFFYEQISHFCLQMHAWSEQGFTIENKSTMYMKFGQIWCFFPEHME